MGWHPSKAKKPGQDQFKYDHFNAQSQDTVPGHLFRSMDEEESLLDGGIGFMWKGADQLLRQEQD